MSNICIYTKYIETLCLYENNYNPKRFFNYCKACPNFNRLYSCPPFDQNMNDYLKPYPFITLVALQLFYTEEEIKKYCGKEACMKYTKKTLSSVSDALKEAFLTLESIYPNTLSLGIGGCNICEKCNRQEGKPCRYPDKMRISPEALGFDVTAILKKYFDINVCWSKGTLPQYYTLMGAICSMEPLQITSDEVLKLCR